MSTQIKVQQLILILVILVISGMLVGCPQATNLSDSSTKSRWILSAMVVLGIASIGVSYCCSPYQVDDDDHHGRRKGPKHRGKEPSGCLAHFLESYATVIGVYIFGAGALALRVFYLLSTAQCMTYHFSELTSHDVKDQEEAHLILILLHIVYLVIKIPFLVRLSKVRSRNLQAPHTVGHHALLVVIGVDFADWIFNFLKETEDIDYIKGDSNATTTGEPTLAIHCLNHDTALYQFEKRTMNHVLFPMTLGFMLTSMEVILHVWLLNSLPENADCSQPTQAVESIRQSPLDNLYYPIFRGSLKWRQRLWKRFIQRFNIYTALLLGILSGVLTQYYLVYIENEDGENKSKIDCDDPDEYLYRYVEAPTIIGRILLVSLPSLIILSHCWTIMRTFARCRPNASAINGSDVILIVAATGDVVLRGTQIVMSISAAVDQEGLKWLEVAFAVDAVLSVPQTVLLILVIYYGQRRAVNVHHHYHHTLQGALSFLTLFSFIRWVTDSFFEMEYLTSRAEYCGITLWKTLVELFLPFIIYFRYICVILYLKVKNQLSEQENELIGEEPETRIVVAGDVAVGYVEGFVH